MLGQHHYQPKVFHYCDIESIISQNHLLRKIDKCVDLSFVRKLAVPFYCSCHGRPSIDPELFFRMVLIGYLYHIQSDRQLCEEIQYNLAYRWFCKLNLEDKIPDHSSLTRIRDRLGLDTFQLFFNEIINQCKQQGLVQSGCVMTDGTLFEANASIDSLIKREAIPYKKQNKPSSSKAFPKRKVSNQTHISYTDPDASLAFKRGKSQNLKYNAHLTIDAESRVILDTKVTTGSCSDSHVYLEQLQKITEQHGIPIKKAIADRGYGSGEILQALINKNIEPIIPLHTDKSGSMISKYKGFIYEEKHDRYRCPAGKYLLPYPVELPASRVTYRLSGKVCKHCPMEQVCTANKQAYDARTIRRNIHQKLFEKMLKKMKTHHFYQQQTERFWKMEGIISEAKNRHCLSRAKYRGLTKAQCQAYMSASTQNIKKLVAAFFYFLFRFLITKSITKKLILVK